jgi:hypothetical protein
MQIDFAQRARALVGVRFRPQGRDVATGVDCVGLILATFAIDPEAVRRDYRLRGDQRRELEGEVLRFFRRIPVARRRAGDMILLGPAPDQLHLAVSTAVGFVHAHAGIGRVVETPGLPQWPILAAFRRRVRQHRSG